MVIGTLDMLSTNKITGTLRRKMMRQKSKFQPQKGTTEKLNVLISSESSQSHSDDIFQTQSQASTSADTCLLHFTFKNALQIRTFRQGWTIIATAVLHTSTSEIDKKISSAGNTRLPENWSQKMTKSYKYLLYTSTDGRIKL
ncbi:hypothetical protein AVEN_127011-1 [Araneus ventricosus]|uniref:Uncharacterized protein n=1 Tax=Araneus ventricosus TaxID=182803 RepID=A0A4Y2C078_ARAVE|nr:hypothetical protein AVEN_127011-1 [Araneus ventricosus]